MGNLAFFQAADAAVVVAVVTAVCGPMVALLVQGRHTRQAAQKAAHNTAPNGTGADPDPSPYDALVATHEYMIGQIHAVANDAREAAKAAWSAQAAITRNDRKTDALAARVEEGFNEAKGERGRLEGKLDKNISGGATFAALVADGALGVLGRLDTLDGQTTAEALRNALIAMGIVPADPPEEEDPERPPPV